VTALNLVFNRKATGDILVSDISFADEGTTTAEKWLISSGAVVADWLARALGPETLACTPGLCVLPGRLVVKFKSLAVFNREG
jgi:hypothetical protein